MTLSTNGDEPPALTSRGWAVAALAIVTFITALAGLAHIYLGSFGRFMADSYCDAGRGLQFGALGATLNLYRALSGRYSANFLDILMGQLFGPAFAPLWSPLLQIAWLVALASLVAGLTHGAFARYRAWVAALLAILILFVTFDNTPSLGQSVYWSTGLNNYVVPLVLFTAFGALLAWRAPRALHGRSRWLWLGLCLSLNLLIGGFNETNLFVQCAVLGLAVALAWLFGSAELKRNLLPLLLAGLLGAVVALIVVAAAPGNKVRQGAVGIPPDLGTLVLYVLTFTKQVVLNAVTREPLNLLGLPVIAALAGATLARPDGWLFGSNRTVLRTVLWAPVITLALVAVAIVPAAYVTSSLPNNRGTLIVMYVLSLGLAVWGYALGQLYRHWRVDDLQLPVERLALHLALGAVVALFAANTLRTAQLTFGERTAYAAYARVWDQNEARILAARQAGAASVTITQLANPFGIEEPQPDPNHWVNNCLNMYYGLKIMTEAPAQ